jgi:uncharacterized protein (DUF1330 family)
MTAYILVEIEVTESVGYEEYKKMAPASIHAYGGKYLVRGGPAECLEGEWPSKRLVILEFRDRERARAWGDSKEYRPARDPRQRTAGCTMILVDGVSAQPGRT